jgi:hypothetical protein
MWGYGRFFTEEERAELCRPYYTTLGEGHCKGGVRVEFTQLVDRFDFRATDRVQFDFGSEKKRNEKKKKTTKKK